MDFSIRGVGRYESSEANHRNRNFDSIEDRVGSARKFNCLGNISECHNPPKIAPRHRNVY